LIWDLMFATCGSSDVVELVRMKVCAVGCLAEP